MTELLDLDLEWMRLDQNEAAVLLGTTPGMLSPLAGWIFDGDSLLLTINRQRGSGPGDDVNLWWGQNRSEVPACEIEVGDYCWVGFVESIDRTPKGVRLHGDFRTHWHRSGDLLIVSDPPIETLSGSLQRLNRNPDVLQHSEMGTSILSMLGYQHQVLGWWGDDGRWTCRDVECPCELGVGA